LRALAILARVFRETHFWQVSISLRKAVEIPNAYPPHQKFGERAAHPYQSIVVWKTVDLLAKVL
jgi:hypothetical protein